MSCFDGIKTGDKMNNIKDGKGRISYAEYLILKNKGLVTKDDLYEKLVELKNDDSVYDAMENNYDKVPLLVKKYTILTDEDINSVSFLNINAVADTLSNLQHYMNEGGIIGWTYYILPSIFAVNVILED